MKIPLYHKTPEKEYAKSTPKSQPSVVNSAVKNKNAICEIENTIEIQLNSNHTCTYLVSCLLLSWLPMILIIFFVHSTVSHHIEHQRLEVAHLKSQMRLLNREVLFLRRQVISVKVPEMNAIEGTDLSLNLPLNTGYRAKRDTTEEKSIDFKGLAASGRKLPVSNVGRRGNQSSKKRRYFPKQGRRQGRRCQVYNSTKCSGFQAVHLKGAHPETVVEAGHVGPWFIDTKAVKDSRISSSFQLREDGESVEVENAGLYFIYAQVYYLTSHTLNSFVIKLAPKDSDETVTLAYCSGNTVSAVSTSEVSCFTAATHTLQAGDRIFIQQREKNRRLIMRSGHSFLGLIKFANH